MLSDCHTEIDASLALRLHFCSRTNELLIPLTRYLHTLIPTPTEVANTQTRAQQGQGHGGNLRLKPFNSVNFFTSLKAHGSTLPFRSSSKRTEFYERLVFCPYFPSFLATFCYSFRSLTNASVLLFCLCRWLKTPTFGLWLAQQESIVQNVLNDNSARKT